MRLERIGEWEKTEKLIGKLAFEIKRACIMSIKRWGLKAEGIAKKHISNQDLSWVPLNAAYLADKIRKGRSENILVATSDYFQAITSWVDEDKMIVYAGVKKDVRNRDGEVLADIAAVHEYGSQSGRIPARPLWRPTYEETMEWFMASDSRPGKIFLKNIKKYL